METLEPLLGIQIKNTRNLSCKIDARNAELKTLGTWMGSDAQHNVVGGWIAKLPSESALPEEDRADLKLMPFGTRKVESRIALIFQGDEDYEPVFNEAGDVINGSFFLYGDPNCPADSELAITIQKWGELDV